MKLLTALCACLLMPNVAIAATVLTPPITSEPCTTISLPVGGSACVPRLAQF
jgi:hypothetical protein